MSRLRTSSVLYLFAGVLVVGALVLAGMARRSRRAEVDLVNGAATQVVREQIRNEGEDL